jgi:hypothetical protein
VSEYQHYKARFDQNRALLQVPADCAVDTPQYRAIDPISPTSWDFSWWLTFADGHYIRCREHWLCRKSPARRHLFTFHYGPIVRRDSDGKIDRHHTDPVLIRFDKKAAEAPHLHYLAPEPHYGQDQVNGLALDNVDMFQFINAVFRVRQGITEFPNALGFTLR